MDRLLKLARELAAEGPATIHEDCSRALNEMTILALLMAGEEPTRPWLVPFAALFINVTK